MNTAELLKIIACPVCHGDLEAFEKCEELEGLYCRHCDSVYPVEENIPILLVDRAIPIQKWNERTQ